MTNVISADINIIEYATSVSVTSENTNYLKANLYDKRPGKRWKALNTSQQIILFDLGVVGQAVGLDFVCIINTNITDGTTLSFQANATDSWGSPSLDETITIGDTDFYKKLDSTHKYQYWRIVIPVQSTAAAIGQIFLGVSHSYSCSWGSSKKVVYNNKRNFTETNSPWNHFVSKRDAHKFIFRETDTITDGILASINAVRASAIPIPLVDYNDDLKYVTIENITTVRRISENLNEFSINTVSVPYHKEVS